MTPWSSTERAIFADALAEGDTIAKAAKRAGRSAKDGEREFERIRAKLGEQAA